MAAATDEVQRSTVQIRGINVPLKSPGVLPYRSEGQQLTYYEFSTWPLGLSHPVGAGHWANADLFPPFLPEELSDQELSTVAEQLYELLKRLRGYEVAMVGWDPESWVDIEVLESEYVADGSISEVEGLVLSNALIERWGPQGFVPFSSGFFWAPFRHARNILRPPPS